MPIIGNHQFSVGSELTFGHNSGARSKESGFYPSFDDKSLSASTAKFYTPVATSNNQNQLLDQVISINELTNTQKRVNKPTTPQVYAGRPPSNDNQLQNLLVNNFIGDNR